MQTIINGKEAFVKIHDYLVEEKTESENMDICMAGFILENTLSDNGGVTRGVCTLNENKKLVGIEETYNIQKTPEGPGQQWMKKPKRRKLWIPRPWFP